MTLDSSDDVNAHDMYIPTMGFITYILLAGWSLGSAGDFDPAKLGDIASAATGWLVLEVLITLLSLFLLQVRRLKILQRVWYLKVSSVIDDYRLIL